MSSVMERLRAARGEGGSADAPAKAYAPKESESELSDSESSSATPAAAKRRAAPKTQPSSIDSPISMIGMLSSTM